MKAHLTILPDETTIYYPEFVFETGSVRLINNTAYYVSEKVVHYCSCSMRNFFKPCDCESYEAVLENCEGFAETSFEGKIIRLWHEKQQSKTWITLFSDWIKEYGYRTMYSCEFVDPRYENVNAYFGPVVEIATYTSERLDRELNSRKEVAAEKLPEELSQALSEVHLNE
jgi:hypothetical protein